MQNPAYEYQYSAIPMVAYQNLKGRPLKVLIALYQIAGRSNIVKAFRSTLSQMTNVAINKISAITADLVSLGFLKKSGDGGRSRCASYELVIPDQFHAQKRQPKKISPEKTRPILESVSELNPPHFGAGHIDNPIKSKTTPKPDTAQKIEPVQYTQNEPVRVEKGVLKDIPACINEEAVLKITKTLSLEDKQNAVDEFSGVVEYYRNRNELIHSPFGFFRKIVQRVQAGDYLEFALKKQKQRAAIEERVREEAQRKAEEKRLEEAIKNRTPEEEVRIKTSMARTWMALGKKVIPTYIFDYLPLEFVQEHGLHRENLTKK